MLFHIISSSFPPTIPIKSFRNSFSYTLPCFLSNQTQTQRERERERGTELQSLELSDVRDGNGIRERVWRLLGYNQTRDSTASNLGKSCKFLSNGVQNV